MKYNKEDPLNPFFVVIGGLDTADPASAAAVAAATATDNGEEKPAS